ncbi:type VI secretion system ImpA family N-terminal domain-containing protein [uncultured Caballeronia sp.]|jgi:type VI secretion system protein ImpA|uniref:type VI secretion system protein TssA n=1 Tax=uncultured Caballeronia sp. TaxID=1827198 RepID=UPI00157578DE
MNAKKQTAAKARPNDVASHDWLAPISANAPCGPDLEYDPEYVVMSAKSTAQPDAQYGNFVGSAEPVNWGDIDRDCRRLMLRTKDIRIVVLFTRCRTRLAGAMGFSEGVALLARLLEAYPDTVHPQLAVDSDREAALEIRANALQALTDVDGLLSDFREVTFGKASIARLQVRDVERAFARPRPVDALSQDSVTQQLDALRERDQSSLVGFDTARSSVAAITAWCENNLGSFSPDLSALDKLLEFFAGPAGDEIGENGVEADVAAEEVASGEPAGAIEIAPFNDDGPSQEATVNDASLSHATRALTTNRQTALDNIRRARAWFEINEPSSPIPILLRRAEQFVGARYAQSVRAIPTDLLAQWDSEAEAQP